MQPPELVRTCPRVLSYGPVVWEPNLDPNTYQLFIGAHRADPTRINPGSTKQCPYESPYPKALRTHILRFLGPKTILYEGLELF